MRHSGFKALLIAALLLLSGCISDSKPGLAEVEALLKAQDAEFSRQWSQYSDFFEFQNIIVTDTFSRNDIYYVYADYELVVKRSLDQKAFDEADISIASLGPLIQGLMNMNHATKMVQSGYQHMGSYLGELKKGDRIPFEIWSFALSNPIKDGGRWIKTTSPTTPLPATQPVRRGRR